MQVLKRQTSGWISGFSRFVTSSALAILLVLHCLSLDAVAVLLSYQLSLEVWAGVDLPAFVYLALGMGIWLGYTADRLRDVSPKRQSLASTLRHHFHRQHRKGLQLAWAVILLFSIIVGWLQLPRVVFLAGLGFAVGAAFYVFGVSRKKRTTNDRPRLFKRFAVSLLLATSGLWWWQGWGHGTWPDLKLFTLAGLFAVFASWELILLEGRRIRAGSFAAFWIRWGAPLVVAAIGWPLGAAAYATLLFGIVGFGLIAQLSASWPNELKSLLGDTLILTQFLLLAWVA